MMSPNQAHKKIIVNGSQQTIVDDYALIQKKDRAGSDGKNIKCPHCGSTERIFNLRWKIRQCKSCNTEVEKYAWMIDQLDTWRTPR